LCNRLGITTTKAGTYEELTDRADEHAQVLIADFVARSKRGELTLNEQNSYLSSLLRLEGNLSVKV
jgi:hypothetical protein